MSRRKIYYENIVAIGEEEWFWSGNFNALYKRDRNSGEIERVGEYRNCGSAAYSKLVAYKKKIIGLPFAEDKILLYDIKKTEFRYIDIEVTAIKEDEGHLNKFYGFVAKDELLYMIGCNIAFVLVFNMEHESIEKCIDLYPFIDEHERTKRGYMRDAVLHENKLLAPATYDNFVFEIDKDDLHITKRNVAKSGKGFSTICKLNAQIWLLPFDEGEIVVWDIVREDAIRYCVNRFFTFAPNQRNFLCAMEKSGMVWMFPIVGNAVLSYDRRRGEFSDQNEINAFFEKERKTPKFVAADMPGREIVLLTAEISENVIFNVEKQKICFIKYDISETELLRILEIKGEKIVSETEFSLNGYLQFIKNKEEAKNTAKEERCGNHIIDMLFKQL